MGQTLKEALQELFKQRGREVRNEYIRFIFEKAQDIYKEAEEEFTNIWHAAVDNYYSYSPRLYIRHGDSAPGSGGSNLYNALHINLERSSGYIVNFEIDINATEMDTSGRQYIAKKYAYGYIDDGETVVENILGGNRFRGYDAYSVRAGKYSGTLGDICEQFKNDLNVKLANSIMKSSLTFLSKYK